MPIDVENEEILTIDEAAEYATRLMKPSRPYNAGAIYRWIREGRRGVHLERIGHHPTRTTRQAIVRFFEAITPRPKQEPAKAARSKRIEAMYRSMAEHGIGPYAPPRKRSARSR